MEISRIVENQRSFFNTGMTKEYSFRMEMLDKLEKAVEDNEKEICEAL